MQLHAYSSPLLKKLIRSLYMLHIKYEIRVALDSRFMTVFLVIAYEVAN